MKKNTKAVAVRGAREVSPAELQAGRQAFAEEMAANGLVAKTGGKFLRIDVPGAFLICEFISQEERKGKKYKNLEMHLMLDVKKGMSANKDGILCEVQPGKYDLRADGNIPKYIERTEPEAGHLMAFYFAGKQEPSKDWPKGVKSYDIFDKNTAK